MDLERRQPVDFDIELGESKILQPSVETLEIWLDKEVQQQIDRYAATDLQKELGGILVGNVEDTTFGIALNVIGMIIAQKTTADRTSLTFTHETWAQLHKDKETFYPEEKIVGWFHTHPGFGIFLSNYDLFIQQNFFNVPWQVAYVVDPVHKKRGFYRWDKERIVAAEHKMLNNTIELTSDQQVGKKPLSKKRNQPPKSPAIQRKSLGSRKVLAVSLVLSVSLLIATNIHRLSENENETQPGANNPNSQNEALYRTIENQQKEITVLEESKAKLENQVEAYTENRLFFYTVQSGDNLWTISQQFYENPFEYQYLMRLNNLDDPDSLEIGQRLLLYHPTGE